MSQEFRATMAAAQTERAALMKALGIDGGGYTSASHSPGFHFLSGKVAHVVVEREAVNGVAPHFRIYCEGDVWLAFSRKATEYLVTMLRTSARGSSPGSQAGTAG